MKKYLYRGLSVFMGLYLSLCSCIGSYASDSTSSGSEIEEVFEYTEDYVRDNFNAMCRYVSKWYAIISDSIIGSWNDFTNWLDSSGNDDIWTQHPHSPIRNQNGVETYVDVPQEVQQVILNYIQYRIQQNPTIFTECYINSYNFLNTDQFGNYTLYSSIKEVMKQNNGYTFFLSSSGPNASTKNMYMVTVDKSKYPLNFIGTTTMGGFTNVQLEHNWSTFSSFPQNTEGVYIRFFQLPNGTLGAPAQTYQQAALNAGYNSTWVPSIGSVKNTASAFVYDNANRTNVFTNQPDNELVYVFSTINAYKNYNSGSPQPYYLTSDGLSNSNWTVGSGTINTGTLTNANSSYSNVVNNIQSGWTAEQVLALVDRISNSGNGSGSSNNDNDNSKWWERIGNAIGNLIDGLVEVLSTVIEHLSDALLSVIHLLTGYTDDSGVVHEGLFGKLLNLVNSGFNNFLASIFSWLPEEIVTLFTAVLVFGIFFGLLKMLRR